MEANAAARSDSVGYYNGVIASSDGILGKAAGVAGRIATNAAYDAVGMGIGFYTLATNGNAQAQLGESLAYVATHPLTALYSGYNKAESYAANTDGSQIAEDAACFVLGGALAGGFGRTAGAVGELALDATVAAGRSMVPVLGEAIESHVVRIGGVAYATEPGMGSASAQISGAATAKVPVQLYDVMTYGDSKIGAIVADELTGDHMPSYAAIRQNVENTLERTLSREEANALRNNTNVVIVGQDLHEAGRTYLRANTSSKIAGDSFELQGAALLDQTVHLENSTRLGYSPSQLKCVFSTFKYCK
jgi:hypothetical protein